MLHLVLFLAYSEHNPAKHPKPPKLWNLLGLGKICMEHGAKLNLFPSWWSKWEIMAVNKWHPLGAVTRMGLTPSFLVTTLRIANRQFWGCCRGLCKPSIDLRNAYRRLEHCCNILLPCVDVCPLGVLWHFGCIVLSSWVDAWSSACHFTKLVIGCLGLHFGTVRVL